MAFLLAGCGPASLQGRTRFKRFRAAAVQAVQQDGPEVPGAVVAEVLRNLGLRVDELILAGSAAVRIARSAGPGLVHLNPAALVPTVLPRASSLFPAA